MKYAFSLAMALALPFAVLTTIDVGAQTPAAAPAGSTGACKDGSYTSAPSKRGACRGHKGVKDWYATEGASSPQTHPAESTRASKKANVASAPVGAAPAGSTGLCKDGSYTDTATKRGACRGHKGVQEWFGAATTATAATSSSMKPASPAPRTTAAAPMATAPAQGASGMAPPAASTPAHRMPPNPGTMSVVPGGGAGDVWVNSETKVYHCSGDRYYGKTKQGAYMTEADAIAKGNHAARNKTCKQ